MISAGKTGEVRGALKVASEFSFQEADDLLAAIGYGKMTANQILEGRSSRKARTERAYGGRRKWGPEGLHPKDHPSVQGCSPHQRDRQRDGALCWMLQPIARG